MTVGRLFVIALSACSSDPTFPCCHHTDGQAVYTAPFNTDPPTADQRRVAEALIHELGASDTANAADVAIALREHATSRSFWTRAMDARASVLKIREVAAQAEAPVTALGAAYLLSTLHSNSIAPDCSAGVWQLPMNTPGLAVTGCDLQDGTEWDGTPLPTTDRCPVVHCRVDERLDTRRATEVALQGDWMGSLDSSRVVALAGLLTCVTDSPASVCQHVSPPAR